MTHLLRTMKTLLLLAGLAFASLSPVANAEPPLPEIPEANAQFSATQGCVEPTEDMRKNHMEYILHQRDKTLREGVRTRQHSLEECINCHVPPQESGKVVRIDSKEHFCNSCHSYAAVTIDCFQCHRDTPMPKSSAFHPLGKAIDSHHMDARNDEALSADTLQVIVEGQ